MVDQGKSNLLREALIKLRDTIYRIEDFTDLRDFREKGVEFFTLCKGVVWPGPVDIYVYGWYYVVIENQIYDLYDDINEIVEIILSRVDNRSQEVSQILNTVRLATDWCLTRLEEYELL